MMHVFNVLYAGCSKVVVVRVLGGCCRAAVHASIYKHLPPALPSKHRLEIFPQRILERLKRDL